MSVNDLNFFGWTFLISFAFFVIGAFGWYINRSIVELFLRLNREGKTPKYSYLQEWFLPKYRVGLGRFANEEFHDAVDRRAQNWPGRIALYFMIFGIIIQVCLWGYVYNFAEASFSFQS